MAFVPLVFVVLTLISELLKFHWSSLRVLHLDFGIYKLHVFSYRFRILISELLTCMVFITCLNLNFGVVAISVAFIACLNLNFGIVDISIVFL